LSAPAGAWSVETFGVFDDQLRSAKNRLPAAGEAAVECLQSFRWLTTRPQAQTTDNGNAADNVREARNWPAIEIQTSATGHAPAGADNRQRGKAADNAREARYLAATDGPTLSA
jgi:hypothetical protein